MDGHFVPPITIGPLVAAVDRRPGARRRRRDRRAPDGRAPGGPRRRVRPRRRRLHHAHFEADAHINRTLGAIREAGCLAGVALNPGTPADAVAELTAAADVVLCMSVNPGWGGQPFIERLPGQGLQARRPRPGSADRGGRRDRRRRRSASVAEAGATLFVAGSAVFGDPEPAEATGGIAAAAANAD